jgi:hypothetical protein
MVFYAKVGKLGFKTNQSFKGMWLETFDVLANNGDFSEHHILYSKVWYSCTFEFWWQVLHGIFVACRFINKLFGMVWFFKMWTLINMCESYDYAYFNEWTNPPKTCQNWFQVCCYRYIPFLVLKYLHKFHVQLQMCKCTPKWDTSNVISTWEN